MSNPVDVHGLIAEIRKRPALWDIHHEDYKARHRVQQLWQEVAQNIGVDVEQCKRKWKNLRDAFRAERKRSARRIERDKLLGVYESSTKYNSKWVYFPHLSFIIENKQNRNHSIENESSNSDSIEDHNPYVETNTNNNNSVYEGPFLRVNNIKPEPSHDLDDEMKLVGDDGEATSDMLFEEFQNIASPQAATRLSATFSMNNAEEQTSIPQHTHSCRCSKRANEQINFLQDLGKEEQKLMKSTKQDITRSNKVDHVGDSDYNFLVSFLPQMKKMSELENLQFRAKMCDTILTILATTVTGETNNVNVKRLRLSDTAANGRDPFNIVHSTSSSNLK